MKFFIYFNMEKSFNIVYLVGTKGHRQHFWLQDIKHISQRHFRTSCTSKKRQNIHGVKIFKPSHEAES